MPSFFSAMPLTSCVPTTDTLEMGARAIGGREKCVQAFVCRTMGPRSASGAPTALTSPHTLA